MSAAEAPIEAGEIPAPVAGAASDTADFAKTGFVGPFDVYTPEEATAMWRQTRLELFDRSHAIYSLDSAQSGVTNLANYDRHLDVTRLAEHVCRPEIVDRVASVLGDDVLCWRSEFFPKYPGDEGTEWHQAETFANASGRAQIAWPEPRPPWGTLTAWTALTESTVENGCLRLIPGSHRDLHFDESRGMAYRPESIGATREDGRRSGFFGYDYRELRKDPSWEPDESNAIDLVMRPGQCVLFCSTLLHASYPHVDHEGGMRLGYVARYVPPEVVLYPETDRVEEYGGAIDLEDYAAVLVSGQDHFGHNPIARETRRGVPFARRISS